MDKPAQVRRHTWREEGPPASGGAGAAEPHLPLPHPWSQACVLPSAKATRDPLQGLWQPREARESPWVLPEGLPNPPDGDGA